MRAPLLSLILASIAACGEKNSPEPFDTQGCMTMSEGTESCPAAEDVDPGDLRTQGCYEDEVTEVTGAGTLDVSVVYDTGGIDSAEEPETRTTCCYPVLAVNVDGGCTIDGRPYTERDGLTVAELAAEAPSDPIAAAWLRAALMEHASVASFARLSLELMAVGAPLSLLARVQAAAADEVEHARLCFEEVERRTGRAWAPGAFPFQEALRPRVNLAAIAADTVREGCLGETLGAWLASQVARGLEPGPERALLERLAEDEARHAALSWGIVAWLIQAGGAPVRAAVVRALGEPLEIGGVVPLLAGELAEPLLQQGLRAVIQPAAEALLAA
ncbi:MAG: hypothetical protein H6741_13040 [Alphaproteobacteria bacterium]|nr:hypothetical protein [Alphaproteobacteria bacterium]